MIPKILHRTVPEVTTKEIDKWEEDLRVLHPDWECRTYRDPVDVSKFPQTSHLWGKCSTGAQLAGLIRLEALVTHGGIYVDSDVRPLRPFDSLLGLSAFAAWEDESTVPDAVMGAEAEHPAFKLMLKEAILLVAKGKNAYESGSALTTIHLPNRKDVLLLPPGAFYPHHYLRKVEEGKHDKEPWVFCEHVWHFSWGTEHEKNGLRQAQR